MGERLCNTLFFASLVAVGQALAGPLEDATLLFERAKQAPQKTINFSDKTTTWADGYSVYKLASGNAVIVKAHLLALDTDGASKEIRRCDRWAKAGTALPDKHGKDIDSNTTPYYVLPWCGDAKDRALCKQKPPYTQLELQKGDFAMVIAGEKMAFAIAADTGPEKRFGEGSIQLHRQLGHEVIGKVTGEPKCAANEDLQQETFLVIFPKSNNKWLPNEQIKDKGTVLWKDLLRKELGEAVASKY